MPKVLDETQYRLTHPDKDLRALCKRIHRLPYLSSAPSLAREAEVDANGGSAGLDEETEREMTRIEILKWKATIERVVGSAANLGRQAERYKQRSEETTKQAEALEATLEDEKRLLADKLKERDHMIRCDEVYAKITARPKSKEELQEQIVTLRAQIETHRTAHATYLSIVQRRVEAFSAVSPIVDQVKEMRLPIEAASEAADDAMEVDAPSSPTLDPAEPPARLSAAALPFQPTAAGSSRSTAVPPTAPSRAASHALPSRPSRKSPTVPTAPSSSRTVSGLGGRATSASLPQRPSGLRSSATPGRSSLEEGEVEGEEGEVDDRKAPRSGGGRRR